MTEVSELLIHGVLLGVLATATMDCWALLLKYFFAIPSLNWSMVGRWLGHFPKGRFQHGNIADADAVQAETLIGWIAHYSIGVVFAVFLLLITGSDWLEQPTPLPALCFGVITIIFPFFLMQPGMGAGIAASKTPRPNQARLRSLMAHSVFGIGLYLAALLISFLN